MLIHTGNVSAVQYVMIRIDQLQIYIRDYLENYLMTTITFLSNNLKSFQIKHKILAALRVVRHHYPNLKMVEESDKVLPSNCQWVKTGRKESFDLFVKFYVISTGKQPFQIC